MKILLVLLMMAATASAAELFVPVQSEVTKRDVQGRVEVMETRAGDGTCMAQVLYKESVPQIHVLVISRKRIQNLGYLQINDATEEGVSDEVLMRNFEKAIREQCLKYIIRGFAEA